MPQEALLPDTDAILRGTVEIEPYRGGTLVRYKRLDGHVFREVFADPEQANVRFWAYVADLRSALQKQRMGKSEG